jgi:hypothetical protein
MIGSILHERVNSAIDVDSGLVENTSHVESEGSDINSVATGVPPLSSRRYYDHQEHIVDVDIVVVGSSSKLGAIR